MLWFGGLVVLLFVKTNGYFRKSVEILCTDLQLEVSSKRAAAPKPC
jgi:hypothetical protein